MSDIPRHWHVRFEQLCKLAGPIRVTTESPAARVWTSGDDAGRSVCQSNPDDIHGYWPCTSIDARPLVALTSSRIGRSAVIHEHVGRFVRQSLLGLRARRGTLLIACGTAIEPWARRAAELFSVPVLTISVAQDRLPGDLHIESLGETKLNRDEAVIFLADGVDAVMVRRRGTIERALRRRIQMRRDTSTRVACWRDPKCSAKGLIHEGAIGWWSVPTLSTDTAHRRDESEQVGVDDHWTRTPGQWILHCTRAATGTWPGETTRQYMDGFLLGVADASCRSPLDALCRILRTETIFASAIATRKEHPIVCFSAVCLSTLLASRCFRPQLGRWDYEPYGIAIRKSAAVAVGIRPVIYGDPRDRDHIQPEDQYRFHPMGTTFDWTREKEWRSKVSVKLSTFDRSDVRVFAEDRPESRQRLSECRWPVTWVGPSAHGKANR